MAVRWKDDLSIGVEEIDKQHKELIKRLNNMLTACQQGKGKEEIRNVLEFLGEYVVMHFGAEEKYMEKFNYPEYEKHKKNHRDFVREFTDLKQQIEKEGPKLNLVVYANRFLTTWLKQHIKKTDRALGEFLKTKLNS